MYKRQTYGIGNPDRFEPDFGVTFAYITFDSVNALHGVDGDDAGGRGAVLSLSAYVPIDTDGDGVPDHCDPDSDNDGISDLQESGNTVLFAADTDYDGVVTGAEAAAAGLVDADGDGVWDGQATTPVDTDNDGVADYLDLDSDEDGIPDAVEAQPTTGYNSPSIGADADGDGVVDTFDDGVSDHGGSFAHPIDSDWDGTPDYLDTDSDNDGIDDTTESGLTLSGTDADGDGIDDGVAPLSYADTDGVITDPATDLDNEFGDTSEVAYRELTPEIGVAKSAVGQPVAQADGCLLYTSPSPRD